MRQAVKDKDFYWFNRYRTTDGFATFGDRAFLTFLKGNPRNANAQQAAAASKDDILPTNYEVLQREISMLDVMTSNRDRRIWAVARGADVKVDDSDTPPRIDAQTNEPGKGPDGAHVFLDGEEAMQKMTIGKGLKVELFASEKEFPELVNPVQIAFDTRGRLWVAAWKNYPHWEPKTPMDDKLLILEDTNGDGKADKRTVFAGDLNNPTGFEFYNGGVILAQAPNLVFLKDTNGDDRYDTKEILLHGFDTADTHHAINSFTFDPGGALYMGEGHLPSIAGRITLGADDAAGRRRRLPVRAADVEVRGLRSAQLPQSARPRLRLVGPRHPVRRDRRAAVLRPVVLDEEVLPGRRNQPARPGRAACARRPVGGAEILSSRHFPEEMQGNVVVLNVIGFRGLLNYKLE